MLHFYWSIGRDIVEMDAENIYGTGFFEKLSADMKNTIPSAKCFSTTNLRYMKRFYLFISNAAEILPQLGAESGNEMPQENLPQVGAELMSIPWGHIKLLIDKCKNDPDKALFYARQALTNRWSRAVLQNYLDTDLYERQGQAITNFALTLPEPQSDLAQEMTRDPYSLILFLQRD
jgi:hypothetical protein